MAKMQSGIAITIKAFLPIGKSLDEQFEAIKKVKEAHESGDYGEVLKACDASQTEVKAEKVNRRASEEAPGNEQGGESAQAEAEAEDAKTDPPTMQTRRSGTGDKKS